MTYNPLNDPLNPGNPSNSVYNHHNTSNYSTPTSLSSSSNCCCGYYQIKTDLGAFFFYSGISILLICLFFDLTLNFYLGIIISTFILVFFAELKIIELVKEENDEAIKENNQ
jgi:hypothetical protein